MPDAFDLLGIEPRFDVDTRQLGNVHRDLSRALHPDRYASRPSSERRAALGRAIEVNEAFRTLQDPLARGQLLLERLHPSGQAPESQADPGFLMEIMELRENLGEAGAKKDAERIEALADQVRSAQKTVMDELSKLFSQALGQSHDGAVDLLPVIAEKLAVLRYYRRFLDEADALVDDLP